MIKISNIHKAYGRKKVLTGVDLTIETGETMVIIGRSGCGKSVLLKHLVGLILPDRGSIAIDGRSWRASARATSTRCGSGSACCSRARPCSTR